MMDVQQEKEHMIEFDAPPERPCSSSSEGSLGASEVFSLAAKVDTVTDTMQVAVRTLLAGVGEDPTREGLIDTPKRVAKAWLDITAGYRQEAGSVLGQALFNEPTVSSGGGGMVLVRDIEFASTSETDLLPFHGRAHIAYLPRSGVVLGLSKFARLTAVFARRLQQQQRFTDEILAALQEQVAAEGAAVIVEAKHMGEGPEAPTRLTSAANGAFSQPNSSCAAEFLALLRLSGVPVVPSSGMPSGPRTVPEAIERRSVVGRGLRRPATSSAAAALLPPHQAAACQHQHRHSRRQPAEGDTRMMDVSTAAPQPGKQQMEGAVQALLECVGEDTARTGLESSARNYVEQLLASTAGYSLSLPDVLASPQPLPLHACIAGRRNDTAAARGVEEVHIRFGSQCEHHLLPFYGTTHIAYLPAARHGTAQHAQRRLSVQQLEALVAMYSRRLQIQERFTHQLASAVEELTQASGVLVVVEALHLCMVARGVEKHASSTTTVAARGSLETDGITRSQLLLSLCA